MRDEPEVASKTRSPDKTLNSECHNYVEYGNKDGQKNKSEDSPKKKVKWPKKRIYSSTPDESVSDSDRASSEAKRVGRTHLTSLNGCLILNIKT